MRILRTGALAALLTALLTAPARGQEDSVAAAPDSAAPDSAVASDSAAPAADVSRVVPTLEEYRKIAILYRDMLPGTPGSETAVEVFRNAERAQVLRFVTRGVPWAYVVRPAGAADAYTLRDFDCSGGFTEELEAGTPLAVPDCAVPAAPAAAAPQPDDDD